MKTRAMSLVGLLLLLAACGGEGPTEPSGPPPPRIAGNYYGIPMWTTHFKRTHDGYSGTFECQGSMRIEQEPGSSRFTGTVVVEAPPAYLGCPANSFSLTGTVEASGAITIVTRGPQPPIGPCPTPGETTFTGVIDLNRNPDLVSARGTVTVDCPGAGEGEYRFDQILEALQRIHG